MSDSPQILLVTHGQPGGHGAGESYLSALRGGLPAAQLVRYALVDSVPAPTQWRGHAMTTRVVRTSTWPGLSSWRWLDFRHTQMEQIVREIGVLARERQTDVIWMVLNSAEMIALAGRLQAEIARPFGFILWDVPEYLLEQQRLDPLARGTVMREFGEVVRRGTGLAVVSDGMGRYLRDQFGVASTTIWPGVDLADVPVSRPREAHPANRTLAFAGSLYAKREWNALIRALESVQGRIGGFPIKVVHFGQRPRWGARTASFVDYRGHLAPAEMWAALAKADAGYLPYWMDQRHAHAARTAFPSKLATYVAARVPVFFHGPQDSTPAEFLERYEVGVTCASSDSAAIVAALERLLTDEALRGRIAAAQRIALNEQLNATEMARRWCELLQRQQRGVEGAAR